MSLAVRTPEEDDEIRRRQGRKSSLADSPSFGTLSRETQIAVLDSRRESSYGRLERQFGVKLTRPPARRY